LRNDELKMRLNHEVSVFTKELADRDAELQAKAAAKQSAGAKLAALGLTADEIAAIA
jgi:hypothetical protein